MDAHRDKAESRGMGLKYLKITGGAPLFGAVDIQGSKNAVLPVLAACLLGEGTCVVENCPRIGDVEDSLSILRSLGCSVEQNGNTVRINADKVESYSISAQEASRIRSSVLFLGALLGRMGRAVLPLPGGCAIGSRPIDLHLQALSQLGAVFVTEHAIDASAKRLRGAKISLRLPSVGATENTILAAVLADGETVIENTAREPEIDELCAFLKLRGAKIERLKNGSIQIRGVRSLHSAVYRMKPDRIVAGTYALAAAATQGRVAIRNFPHSELEIPAAVLKQMGAKLEREGAVTTVSAQERLRAVPYIETAPYPGFPTDLQSLVMAALCRAAGESRICETLFESRFRTAAELRKMGARISTQGSCACISGVSGLCPSSVEAPDLRGGAALVLAALQAQGSSMITGTQYIERGYEDICRDLRGLGADIVWESDETNETD